ncbi:MlaD family protein [Nocardia sp. NPDC056064]|uniref:MlaD family protein n=1 Tax=Nocardia sp. NPDC056064 TaxID=3345701 RepID=UPI0035E05669
MSRHKRAPRLIIGAVVVTALVVAGYFAIVRPPPHTGYCALMPDTIGVFVGSPVTMRGVPVGTVESISQHGTAAKVDFIVVGDRPVYADAGATTLTNSLTFARQLAIVDTGTITEPWDNTVCLSKTVTPKSMSDTLNAFAQLSEQLLGPDPAQSDALARGLGAVDAATAGTGPVINEIVLKLGSAVANPDAGIARLTALLDAVSAISGKITSHWGDVKTMVTMMAPLLQQSAEEIIAPGIVIMRQLRSVLPILEDLADTFGGSILAGLNDTDRLLNLLRTGVGALVQLMSSVPVLVQTFQSVAATEPKPIATQPVSPTCAGPSQWGVCAGAGPAELLSVLLSGIGAR